MSERNIYALVAIADQTCKQPRCRLMLVCQRIRLGGQVAVVPVINNNVAAAKPLLKQRVNEWARSSVAVCRDPGNPFGGQPVAVRRLTKYTTAEVGN